MLTEELNFRLEARYTEIFRRVSKDHKHVSAPKVFAHLCDNDVLVTEFVSGVFLNEILHAIERGNPADLDQLLRRGFSPKKISQRMMQIFHWECFESLFFHADPHPANIIVRPDNTIIMIDFGSCGSVSSRTKRKLMEFNRHMAAEDLHAMVQNTIAMLEPLPPFDVDSFSIDLMNIYREVFFALKSKHSPWHDKCSGGTWMRVIALGQKYRIPMTLDTVRMFRASFMYDSIIYRLNPRLDPIEEFRKWAESWDKKHRRRIEGAALERILGPIDSDFTMSTEVASLLRHALDKFGNMLDKPSYNFGFTISKVAYFFTVLIKAAGMVCSLALVVSLVRMLLTYSSATGATPASEFMRALAWTLNNRLVLVGVTVYVVIAVRKILFRLEDVDVN
jgi:predicted unusual protein kinase regulating ubiquinone biosynthesis (AarF/ABC1/UbiB family)